MAKSTQNQHTGIKLLISGVSILGSLGGWVGLLAQEQIVQADAVAAVPLVTAGTAHAQPQGPTLADLRPVQAQPTPAAVQPVLRRVAAPQVRTRSSR